MISPPQSLRLYWILCDKQLDVQFAWLCVMALLKESESMQEFCHWYIYRGLRNENEEGGGD